MIEKSRTPPWRKKRPKKGPPKRLTDEQKAAAKARAARAGRPYPNLIDNMWASTRGPR